MSGPLQTFITPDGTFVCTLTSNSYKFLTLNLVRSIQRLRPLWKLCVVCADKGSFRYFQQEGIPCRLHVNPMPETGPNVIPFGTRLFQALNRKKLELLAAVASTPEIRTAVYLDGDIVMYNDPVPDLVERLAAPDAPQMLFQCDEQTRVDCSGSAGPGSSCTNPCSGVIAWRHGLDPTIFKIQGEELQRVWNKQPEDQIYIQHMVRLLGVPFATLPRNLYPNGMWASFYGPDSALKRVSKLLHYNYIVGNMKQKRMKANGDWLIPY